ncbi:TIGR04222 domain-containing membrane protein [Streptosporangium sp. 'caverna']|uniref:TIGR04222 domain-containing membrane protein n=1 Tax=Streptosporangium sp. 'caverna' TaxID=2202249 RepID=UPI000D7E5E60|nr:TIGR04222 domain-containing membrane protein [Streptosporangium sp. 'caverna']AWS46780.1 hypothetical protein DKM19_41270 [Streptosporangium sp. 'caverna']
MQAIPYVVVIVLILLGGFARTALRREHRRVRSAVTHHRGEMTPYELAYLAGGPRRVINTALGMLARAGAIRVSRGGQVSLVAGTRISPDPVEHALLESLQVRGGSCSVGELRRTVADGETMSGLRYRLMGMGLIVPDEALGHAWKLLNRLLILSVLALVVNVGMLLAGIFTSFPGVVVPLLGAFMALRGLVTYSTEKRALRGILSQAGREALDSARRLHVRGARPMTPDLAFAVGVPVALYGLGELGDPTLEEELKRDSGYTSTTGCAAGSCGGGSFGSGDGSFGSGGWGGDSGGSGDSGGGSGGDSGGGSSCGGGGGCGGGGCGGG